MVCSEGKRALISALPVIARSLGNCARHAPRRCGTCAHGSERAPVRAASPSLPPRWIRISFSLATSQAIPTSRTPLARCGNGGTGSTSSCTQSRSLPARRCKGTISMPVTREAHTIAHDVSAYSFAALAKAARPMMQGRDGSLLALTYIGATRPIFNYNVMGPAKASLEANVRYVAAALGPRRHQGERHLRRADQDAGRGGDLGLPEHTRPCRGHLRAPAQRHHRRRRQRRRVSVFGSRGRRDRRGHPRGRRVQHDGHGGSMTERRAGPSATASAGRIPRWNASRSRCVSRVPVTAGIHDFDRAV